MNYLKIVLILLLINSKIGVCQNIGSAGFFHDLSIANIQAKKVRPHTNICSQKNFIIYVGYSDNLIYCIYYDELNNSWINYPQPLYNSYYGKVKIGTQLLLDDNLDIYYISNINLIHKLSFNQSTSSPHWVHSIPYSNQPIVSEEYSELVKFNENIYYVNETNNISKVCVIKYDNNNSWTGGPIYNLPSINVRKRTNLIATQNHIYFVGEDDFIYDHFLNNQNQWTYSFTPLGQYSSSGNYINIEKVSKNTQIKNYNDEIFYVGDQSLTFNHLYYDLSANEWVSDQITANSPYQIEISSDFTINNKDLYFINQNNNISIIKKNQSSWDLNEIITSNSNQEPPSYGTKLLVTKYLIYEEGSNSVMFESTHIFYSGGYSDQICYFIWDDKLCQFTPPGCEEENDTNNNCTGWDVLNSSPCSNPTTPCNIANQNCAIDYTGYDCEDCKENGYFTKTWHYSKLDNSSSAININNNKIIFNSNDNYFFVDNDSQINLYSRKVNNNPNHFFYGAPLWNDEFNLNDDLSTSVIWKEQFPWGNPDRYYCSPYCIDPVLSEALDGDLILKVKDETLNAFNCNYTNINTSLSYSFKASVVTSELQGGNSGTIMQYPDQYSEVRAKLPRSKLMWPAYWLSGFEIRDTVQEYVDINVFEAEPNGKVMIFSGNNGHEQYQAPATYYAVGYRLYDNYYTYGMRWSNDEIWFYFNNVKIARIENNGRFNSGMPFFFTLELADVRARCEILDLDQSFNIDYLRIYNSPQYNVNQNKEINLVHNSHSEILNNRSIKINTYDLMGRLIYTTTDEHEHVIHLNEITKPGVFIIEHITTGGSIYKKMFIK